MDAMGLTIRKVLKSFAANLKYMIVGIVFGIVFVKAEIVSWFRIQEMFRLDSFHSVRRHWFCRGGGAAVSLADQRN